MKTIESKGTTRHRQQSSLGFEEVEIRLRGLVAAYERARARSKPSRHATLDSRYARSAPNYSEPDSLQGAVESILSEHPVWPWMSRFPGVHSTLTARLVVRLDITKSDRASSFAAVCGLDTHPGNEYSCTECGWRTSVFSGNSPPIRHHVRGTRQPCTGELTPTTATRSGRVVLRMDSVAPPELEFDPHARMLVHKIARALIHSGTRYKAYSDDLRETLRRSQPDWTERRLNAASLRKVQTLYLRHLWIVWRAGLGFQVPTRTAGGAFESPWSMV